MRQLAFILAMVALPLQRAHLQDLQYLVIADAPLLNVRLGEPGPTRRCETTVSAFGALDSIAW